MYSVHRNEVQQSVQF